MGEERKDTEQGRARATWPGRAVKAGALYTLAAVGAAVWQCSHVPVKQVLSCSGQNQGALTSSPQLRRRGPARQIPLIVTEALQRGRHFQLLPDTWFPRAAGLQGNSLFWREFASLELVW